MPDHEHDDHEHDHHGPGPGALAGKWDSRYRQNNGAMWRGRPNGRFMAELAVLNDPETRFPPESFDLVSFDFTIERHSVESRLDPPPDTPPVADLVLRTRRD